MQSPHEYIPKSAQFRAQPGDIPQVLAWGLGLVTETIEVYEKILEQSSADTMRDELGDCMWYLCQLCEDMGYSFSFLIQHTPNEMATWLTDIVDMRSALLQAKEIGEWIKKHYFHSPRDKDVLFQHLALYMEYMHRVMLAYGGWQLILEQNIAKLTERHGEKFQAGYKS